MSTAIYYYPDPAGTLETITLPDAAGITEVQDDGHAPLIGESLAGDGGLYQTLLAMPYTVSIRMEKLTGESSRRSLENLLNHLRRGGSCGVAINSAKAWGSFIAIPPAGPARGATSIPGLGGQAWYSSSASLASGDAIVLETGHPFHLTEVTTTTATVANGATSVSCSSILASFPATPTHVRYRDFWPICRMSAGNAAKRAITSARRITYDVELDLYYDMAAVMALAGSGPRVRQAGSSKFAGQSVEESLAILNNALGSSGFGGFNG